MDVKIKIFQTPKPAKRAGETLQHARVQSKGTRTMDDICAKIIPLGLNTAQLKGILDGLAVYIGESLRDGYHIELEDVGTFSLSVRTRPSDTAEKMTVEVDGVNFRCCKKLIARAKRANLTLDKQQSPSYSLEKRKKQMLEYFRENSSLSIKEYARLNYCSQYQAKKDLDSFEEKGVILQKGKKTHQVYVVNSEG